MTNELIAFKVARGVIEMQQELQHLRDENAELVKYRDKYLALLQSNIDTSRETIGSVLAIAMKPGVLDAISKANKDET